jgi:hypothetical protein
VLQRLSQRRRADADRLRRNRDASAVEGPHGDAKSFARTADERVRVHLDVAKLEIRAAEAAHAEGVLRTGARDSGGVHRHDERADPTPADARLRRGEHDHDIGGLGVRHPHLVAADHVAALVEPRDGLLVGGIGASVLLGQGKRAERSA